MSRVHRFYLPETNLEQDFWLHDERLLNQWNKVLRFKSGQEAVLFDGRDHDRLYKIVELKPNEAHVQLVTEYKRQLPSRDVYLFWALLKNDKNDWVLQKATELGVNHFVPLLTERSEKQGLKLERATKILIEAAEQCGRSNIPNVREPILLATALQEFHGKLPLYICEQTAEPGQGALEDALGIFIGPEGGWSDAEKDQFQVENVKHLVLSDFTLRAETAALQAVGKILS